MNYKGYTIYTSHCTTGWRWAWVDPSGVQQISMLYYVSKDTAVNGAIESINEDIQTQEFTSGDYGTL